MRYREGEKLVRFVSTCVCVCVISDCEKSGLKVRHAVLERVCHDSEFDTVTDQLKEMIVAESLQ